MIKRYCDMCNTELKDKYFILKLISSETLTLEKAKDVCKKCVKEKIN